MFRYDTKIVFIEVNYTCVYDNNLIYRKVEVTDFSAFALLFNLVKALKLVYFFEFDVSSNLFKRFF